MRFLQWLRSHLPIYCRYHSHNQEVSPELQSIKANFAQKLAHDLKNPLGVALTNLELLLLLLEKEEHSEKINSAAKNAMTALRSGINLVSELKDSFPNSAKSN